METKRFIGNDMPRIYARVKRDFGADAVIVRTRSLFREGAEPLIEVIAAPPEDADGIPFELQRVLTDEAISRAADPGRGLTIGDLEDLVARELDQRKHQQAEPIGGSPFSAEQPYSDAPEWFEGDVEAAPSQAGDWDVELLQRPDRYAAHEPLRFPLPDGTEPTSPPSTEWANRPRPGIITRSRREPQPAPPPEPVVVPLDGRRPGAFASNRQADPPPTPPGDAVAGIFDRLVAEGFSREAAHIVARGARPGDTPALALAACLEAMEVRYPEEHHTAMISIQGPVASGRTTALMRMALDCADSGRATTLVAADGVHVAAREQVRAYGEAIGLDAISTFEPHEVIRAATRATLGSCLFIDTPAGSWQSPPIAGIPHFAYLALPCHWARETLEGYVRGLNLAAFSGVILTFTDVATNLSPILSLIVESGMGIAFLSSNRDVSSGIQVADPLMLASGIFTTPTRESTNGRLSATA